MAILNKTPLNSSDKHDLLLKTLSCQAHGDISLLAEEFNVSRKTVYAAKACANKAIQQVVNPDNIPDVITTAYVDVAHLRRAIVALSITAPNSIRAIQEQIPILFPGCKVSYGYIQGVIVEAQEQAKKFNEQVPLSKIKSIALDEMFSQGSPVLAGIDLDNGYLFSLSHENKRDGEVWAKVLTQSQQQGLSPMHVVKDGAKGMAKGVNDVFPLTEQRDDAFHALYIAGKAVQKLERLAYRHIEKEVQMQKRLERVDRTDQEALKQAEDELRTSQHKCQKRIVQYDNAAKAIRYVRRSFASINLKTGALMTQEQAQEWLTKAVSLLREAEYKDCDSAARYLNNRLQGLTLATQALYEKLQALSQAYPKTCIEVACRFFERKRQLKKAKEWQRIKYEKELLGSYYWLKTHMQDECDTLMFKVEQLLHSRHRASSAIEGFNATLRSYLYVRKGVNQGFLELFKAWHNLRNRRWGRNQGTSAYEKITGCRVNDWLTVLGFAPSGNAH